MRPAPGNQAITLTVQTPGVFLLGVRNANHAAGLRLAAQVTNQRTNHPISIDPVRLRPSGTPVHLQTGRIEDVVVNAVRLQHAMQPEPVISGLVTGHHLDWPNGPEPRDRGLARSSQAAPSHRMPSLGN